MCPSSSCLLYKLLLLFVNAWRAAHVCDWVCCALSVSQECVCVRGITFTKFALIESK